VQFISFKIVENYWGGTGVRASELEGKEIIDLASGDRLGMVQKSELLLNMATGMVEALIFIKYGLGGREKEVRTIPWQAIRKVSEDLIIVESQGT
jgi:YlmC/YmxH family sporulation protein